MHSNELIRKCTFAKILLVRFLLVLLVFLPGMANCQADSSEFTLSLEFRPRFEYRNGYRQLPDSMDKPAGFVSQRLRLNLRYTRPCFIFQASIQDVRIWGQYGIGSAASGLGLFEGYVEFGLNKHWSLRMGRQAVELDNGRLFSMANWNQASQAHEGLNVTRKDAKTHSELMGFYNQSGEQIFGTTYDLNSKTYLAMGVHYWTHKINEHFDYHLLNVADAYQKVSNPKIVYTRGTSGGRINVNYTPFTFTVCGFYQYGQNKEGSALSAYYIQPEASVRWNPFGLRLGMEYMSGTDQVLASNVDHSFVPLYGVTFKFMGNINQFTTFPSDVGGGGLINPYLFLETGVKKWKFKIELHEFLSQSSVVDKGEILAPHLGVEADVKFKYTFNDFIETEGGIAYMHASESLGRIQNTTNFRQPTWAFLMVKVSPQLLRIKQPLKKLRAENKKSGAQ